MAREQYRKRPFVIGLVGGVASGKSHVARTLQELGASLIDADVLGHEVLTRPLIARRLGQIFGEQILKEDGTVDRRKLGQIVFGEDAKSHAARAKLEEVVHPLIHATAVQNLRSWREQTDPPAVAVIDAPLLLEAEWAPMCDAIIFVDTPDSERLQRARSREWTESQFRYREAAQMPLDEKRQQATHIIPGDAPPAELTRLLKKLLAEINR